MRLPSSQSSPRSTRPSPHSRVQVGEQPSFSVVLPSSHSSPGSSRPLPQPRHVPWSSRHSRVQLTSPPVSPGPSHRAPPRSPPSHSSLPSLRPFPHIQQPVISSPRQSDVHVSRPPFGQVEAPTSAPSHASLISRMPLPHTGSHVAGTVVVVVPMRVLVVVVVGGGITSQVQEAEHVSPSRHPCPASHVSFEIASNRPSPQRERVATKGIGAPRPPRRRSVPRTAPQSASTVRRSS